MKNPILPQDKEERLETLMELLMRDKNPRKRFEIVTHYAETLFDVSMAHIALESSHAQTIQSRCNLNATEVSSHNNFCEHAICANEIMIVNDTLNDPRFADHPLVIGDQKIRFYVGAPLETKAGQRIGTLCLVDHAPRQLRNEELQQLHDLTSIIVRELQGEDATTND